MKRNQIGEAALKKLTRDGRDWLTLALDPFHDYQHTIAGFPDADDSHTVVQCFQYALDINKPPGAAGNWDAHIISHPWVTSHTFNQHTVTTTDALLTPIAGAPSMIADGITVIKADAGQALYPNSLGAWNPSNLAFNVVDLSTDIGAGVSRVIGYGYEIVNTTAEINKQGALTVYRMAQEPVDTVIGVRDSAAPTFEAQINPKTFRYNPSSPAEAALLGGTRQWSAAEGAYVVVPLATVNNPLTVACNRPLVESSSAQFQVLNDTALVGGFNGLVTNAPPIPSLMWVRPVKTIPYCTTGVMLTGLSNASTFRIKVKVYVERAPSFAEASLSVLATPSAPYDARVLQLYSSLLQRLPVAVPVAMNAAGDWWKAILGTISAVAPAVGMLFPGPGTLIGSAVGTAAGLGASLIKTGNSDKPRPQTARPLVTDGQQRRREIAEMRRSAQAKQAMARVSKQALSGTGRMAPD